MQIHSSVINYIQGSAKTNTPQKPLHMCGKDTFVSNHSAKETSSPQKKTFTDFINGTDEYLEQFFLTHDFEQYKKDGIPLKYKRDDFINDINSILKNLSENEQDDLLAKFNLKKGFDDIDGIAQIKTSPCNSTEEEQINVLIKKYYNENESTALNIEEKTAFDTLIRGLPEFNMVIGKKQHQTHIYSVDVHSLIVLQKCMRNPLYADLSDEDKQVLKLSALMHDFGKKGNVPTKGHSSISKKYAESVLENVNVKDSVKERVIRHIDNHHWFQSYNQGFLEKNNVINMFPEKGDAAIAKILTKSDFESVKPNFHLRFLIPNRLLTQKEFDFEFDKMMSEIF